MGFTAALLGGISGTGIHMMTNAMRKVPLSRDLTPSFSLLMKAPYLHVGYFFVGCWAGNAYVKLEKSLVEDINQIRQDKGMPPIVGSNAWIRYSEK